MNCRGLSTLVLVINLLLGVGLQAESKPSGSELIKSHFKLIDHHGNSVTEKSYYGKYTLVFFGFTHCPKVCPLGLSTIAAVLRKLGGKSMLISPIFISVDPERDTPQRLAEYLKNFDPRMIGLSGTQEQIAEASASFRAYYSKIKSDNAEAYSFDHSAVIYLMDRQGNYLAHFASSQGAEIIAAEIMEILLK